MDRLVKPDVKEVELSFKKGQECSTTFRLTNLMHTMSVAVCLTTSNPSLFSFTRPFSILPPLSSSSYILQSQPSHHPALRNPPDIITVRSCMLPAGKAHPNDLRRLFSHPGPHVFRDATIQIYFVGPHTVESFISNPTPVSESSFLWSKAVSGCTDLQLTTLLKLAVSAGKLNMVSCLIDAGADVNVKESNGKSLLSAAVKSGNVDLVKVLIYSGIKIDNSVDLILHYAAAMNRVDLIEILCKNFRDIGVNRVDTDGLTPIHLAAVRNRVEAIHYCVSHDGDPDAVDLKKWTPLHYAAAEGHLESVRYLLKCSSVKYAINGEGKTAFDLAVENGHEHLFDLLRLGDLLQRAVRMNDVDGVRRWLGEGAKVNGRDQNGWTALHRAAFKGAVECVKVLIEYGAKVEEVDEEGYTPVDCAIEGGHVKVALMLVADGAKASDKGLKKLVEPPLKVEKVNRELVVGSMSSVR